MHPAARMVLRLLLALPWLPSTLATADPGEIDPDHPLGPAYNRHQWPAIGFDGDNFLVTWCDGRAGRWMVGGAFLAPHAGFVDSTNLFFPMLGSEPTMAHDGSHHWILALADNHAVRVSSSGQALDATPLQVLPASTASGGHGALAFGASVGLVASNPGATWYGDPLPPEPAHLPAAAPSSVAAPSETHRGWHASGGVSVARLGRDGTLLDPAPIVIRKDAAAARVSVAAGGEQFLVAWGEASAPDAAARLLRVRVNQTGAVLDSIPMELVSPSWYLSLGSPRLLSAPSGYWMVYELGFNTFGGRLQAVRLDLDGTITGTIDLGSDTSRLSGDGAFAAAALGDTVLVAWSTLDNSIECLRFDSAGILPASRVELLMDSFGPAVGAGDGVFLVAASKSLGGSWDEKVVVKRVLVTGEILDASEVVLPWSTNAQLDLRLATAADRGYAVWNDYRSVPGTIRLAPVGFDAVRRGSVVDLSLSGGVPRNPVIAATDQDALVLWGDRFDPWYGASYLVACRVDGLGAPAPPHRLRGCVAVGEEPLQVSWGGQRHLAVWSGSHLTPDGWAGGITCVRLTRAGAPVDSVFADSLYVPAATQLVSTTPSDVLGPAVTAIRDGWCIAWGQTIEYSAPRRVLVARVDSLGNDLDPGGIVVAEAGGFSGRPDVACAGDQCLVVWAGLNADRRRADIYAARVGSNGVVLDPQGVRITDNSTSERDARVVFDGVLYRIAWLQSNSSGTQDCYWATFSPAGILAEPPTLAASGVVTPPALARTAGSAVLAGFSWVHPEWRVPRASLLAVAAAEERLRPQLLAASANPCLGPARFVLTLPAPASVEARVYDVRGRLVNILYSGNVPTGVHPLVWDGKAATGEDVSAGVYLVRIAAGTIDETHKVVRVK